MSDVVAIGKVLIDFVQEKANEDGYPVLSGHPGGAPANFLAPICKYGLKGSMISKVGNDAFGRALIKTLKENGIKTNNIVLDDETFTTLAFVTLSESGDRSFSFARKPGADTRIKYEDINLKDIDSCKVFHFGTLSLTANPSKKTTYDLLKYAKSKGKLISFDPNLREALWDDLNDAKKQMLYGLKMADIVKISDNEVKFLFDVEAKDGISLLLKKYPNIKLLYITCGALGCYYATKNVNGFMPSLKGIKVKDTTGAGDIFGGSAMYKFLSKKKKIDKLNDLDLKEIVEFATVSAGLSTTKYGGLKSVANYEEITKVLNK